MKKKIKMKKGRGGRKICFAWDIILQLKIWLLGLWEGWFSSWNEDVNSALVKALSLGGS